jgi:membrane protease YdiL (CAAX protease family)
MDKKKLKVRALYIILVMLVIHLAREMYIALAIYNHLQKSGESYYLAYIPALFVFLAVYIVIRKSNSSSQPILHFSFKRISLLKLLVLATLIAIIETPIFIGLGALYAWITATAWPDLAIRIFGFGTNVSTDIRHPIQIILLGALVRGVIVPIYEELYFRALLINALLSKYSVYFSITISSLVFALIHSPDLMPSVFLSGLLYAFLYIKYQNILLPIICHGMGNIFLYMYQYSGELENFKNKSIEQAQNINSWSFEIGAALIGVLMLSWIIRKERLLTFDVCRGATKD